MEAASTALACEVRTLGNSTLREECVLFYKVPRALSDITSSLGFFLFCKNK